MKFTNLSNFQKEQYTNYLESQLQKFSSFMLHQRKENEKYKILEDAITYQSQLINKISSRLQLLQIYQDRNRQSYNQIHKKYSKMDEIEYRLGKIQIGVEKQLKEKWKNQKEMRNFGQGLGEKSQKGFGKEKEERRYQNIVKRQQQESSSREKSIKSHRQFQNQSILDSKKQQNYEQKVGKKQLRKLQKKISAMLKQKFQDLSLLMQRKKSRKKIAPSAQTSQLSIIQNYHIRQPKQIVNSFRIDDSFSKKSQQSTFLNNTQTTTKTKSKLNKEKQKSKRSKKSKSRSKSSNRSRSISKSSINNQQNKLNMKQKSHYHKKHFNKKDQVSFSHSQYSKSSLSRSKSPLQNNRSKVSQKRQDLRSCSSKKNEVSRSKSSKISNRKDSNNRFDKNLSNCHLKCIKRPQVRPQCSHPKKKDKSGSIIPSQQKVKRHLKQRRNYKYNPI